MKKLLYSFIIFFVLVSISGLASAEKFKSNIIFDDEIDTKKIFIDKTNNKIKISSTEHKQTKVKIKKSDIEALGHFSGSIRVSHYTDENIQDWSIVYSPIEKNGYFEIPVEFSTVVIDLNTNTIANFDMESWSGASINDWVVATGTCTKSSYHVTGSYSAMVTGTPATIRQTGIPVTSGEKINLYGWAYSDDSGNIAIYFYTSGGEQTGVYWKSTTKTGQWERLSLEGIKVPAGTATMTIQLTNTGVGSTDFDTIIISKDLEVNATETTNNNCANTTFQYTQTSGITGICYTFDTILLANNAHGKLGTPTITIDGTPISQYYRIDGYMYYIFQPIGNGLHTVTISQPYNLPPNLLTPADGSTWNFDYPPMYDDVTFSWEETYTICEIQVAEDSAFSNIVYSHETVDNTATCSLAAGTYYWRVRSYDPIYHIYSDFPDEYSVVVVATTGGVSGTGIMGTIYYSAGLGNYQYIPSAVVTLYNDTFSVQKTTGSVGYYQFLGLTNGTYYVKVEADGYEPVSGIGVNVLSNQVYVQDVALQKEQSYFAPHNVKFVLLDGKSINMFGYSIPLYNSVIKDATILIYENSNTNTLYSQNTGSDGSVGFQLSENVRYRIVIQYDGKTQTEYITPTLYEYTIYWNGNNTELMPIEQFYENVNISISKSIVNSNVAKIDINYIDSTEKTNSVYFTVSKTLDNGTLSLLNTSNTYYGNSSMSLYVSEYKGETYTVKGYIDHQSFGIVEKTFTVPFSGSNLAISGYPILILIIIISFIIGAKLGSENVGFAGFLISGFNWIMWYLGCFEFLSTNTLIGVGLTFATILSLMYIYIQRR